MQRPLTLVLAVLAACGREPAPLEGEGRLDTHPEVLARSEAQVFGPIAGSSVYLGGRFVLTNWHVALTGALVRDVFAEAHVDLPLSDEIPHYERGDPVDGPARGRLTLDDAYCMVRASSTSSAAYYRADGDLLPDEQPRFFDATCFPVDNIRWSGLRFTWDEVATSTTPPRPRLAYANKDLDLAIVEVDPRQLAAWLNGQVSQHLHLGPAPVARGQPVVMIGHPEGAWVAVVETCRVDDPAVAPVLDPDREHPSTLYVDSFTIDCVTTRPGSSGSPVFDAKTGDLLGLVWTADDHETYVSAASAWRAYLGERGRDAEKGLAALFDEDRASFVGLP